MIDDGHHNLDNTDARRERRRRRRLPLRGISMIILLALVGLVVWSWGSVLGNMLVPIVGRQDKDNDDDSNAKSLRIMAVSVHGEQEGRAKQQQEDTAPTDATATLFDSRNSNNSEGMSFAVCESPSLPRSNVHIVVAAYKYDQPEGGIHAFDDTTNYLWDLGLTNADIFWYRRVEPRVPLRSTLAGPCGMQLHERLLLPNFGRDGSAFYDYVLEVYDRPPKVIVFLHGHAAIAWHTSCEAVFARTTYVYRNYVKSFRKQIANVTAEMDADTTSGNQTTTTTTTLPNVLNHMMTLTSHPTGTRNFDLSWYGGKASRRRRLTATTTTEDDDDDDNINTTATIADGNHTNTTTKEKSPCELFRDRWYEQVFRHIRNPPPYQSCCASFVLPGDRIKRYPLAFYQDLQSVLTDQTVSHLPQYSCFEFIVYEIFGDDHGRYTQQQLQSLYDDADGLVYGRKNHSVATFEPDDNVLHRMERCKLTKV